MTLSTPPCHYKTSLHNIQHPEGRIAEESITICSFCEKMYLLDELNHFSCTKMAGKKNYCPFCLRNNFHHRSSNNVLMMSFRGVFGWYHSTYLGTKHDDLVNMISIHTNIGLASPVFSYDNSVFLWFINFNHIGNHPRKAPFKEVTQVVLSMLDAFEPKTHLIEESAALLEKRFIDSIEIFYHERKRPADRRALIPTLDNLKGVTKQNDDFVERCRKFTRKNLHEKS